MSDARGDVGEATGDANESSMNARVTPSMFDCTIACRACEQLAQTAQTGGQFAPSRSSGHGSKQTDANAIAPRNCAARIASSVNARARRDIREELYHSRPARPAALVAALRHVRQLRRYGRRECGGDETAGAVSFVPIG